MPLEKQIVPISFARGVDTKTDPKQVVMGKLLTLENALFQTSNSFIKRNGFSNIGNSISSGNAFSSYLNEGVSVGGGNVYSYSKNQNTQNLKGNKVAIDVSTQTISNSQAGNATIQSVKYIDYAAHASGLGCAVWTEGGLKAYYSIIDTATGQFIVSGALITTDGTQVIVKVITFGSYFVIVYGKGNQLSYVTINVATPTVISAPVALFTAGSNLFDMVVINQRIFFTISHPSNTLVVFYMDNAFVVSAPTTVVVATSGRLLLTYTVFSDSSNNVWVGYIYGTTGVGGSKFVEFSVYDYNLSSALASNVTIEDFLPLDGDLNVLNIVGITSGSTATFYYSFCSFGRNINDQVRFNTADTSTYIVGTPDTFCLSVSAVSKPFIYSGQIYLVCSYSSYFQPTYFIFNGNKTVVAKFAQDNGQFGNIGLNTPIRLIPPAVSAISSKSFSLPYFDIAQSIPQSTEFPNIIQGVSLETLTFDNPITTINGASNLQLSGGILSMYDGNVVVEHGFNVFPELLTGSFLTTGGHMDDGSYQYVDVYQWQDAQGNIHRSSPGTPVTVVISGGGGNGKAFIGFPALRITDKIGVVHMIYRTAANGTIFYLLTTSGGILNDKTANGQSYTDTANDTTITGSQQLYTTGGVVDNIAVPPCTHLFNFNQRMFAILEDEPNTVWFSQSQTQGTPVSFSDLLSFTVDTQGGSLVCGIQMDDKAILFKKNTIFYFSGSGPSPNGLNNDFSTPQVIASDAGCINKRSIVLMPSGVMFQSYKGIYMLDRSLQVEYIGADVESYNSQTITSAKLIKNLNQVRLTLSSGVMLVFDYYCKQWTVFPNQNASDSDIFQDVHTYLTPSGQLVQETPGVYNDNGAVINIRIVSGWLSFAGLQGYQRSWKLLLLGQYKSPHTLLVQFAHDFASSFDQATSIPVLSPPQKYQYRINMRTQKSEAIQISITEQQSGSPGEGLSLSGMTFLVGMKKGTNRLPAANAYG